MSSQNNKNINMDHVVLDKILKATDTRHRLTFGVDGLPFFRFDDGVNYIDFVVVDLTDGSTRQFRLYKRKDGHPKPVIGKGWMDYVNSKALRMGDRVTIRVNYVEGAMFNIRAQRTDIMVWGEPFWYDI
ncbi:hypothetical protein ACFE04_022005 [Oxalis oulophora]